VRRSGFVPAKGIEVKMPFFKPMLASQIPAGFKIQPGLWAVEPKLDGHRLIATVNDGKVRAWSRAGNARILAPHLTKALAQFPDGTYDGELTMPDGRCYNVKELVNDNDLVYMVFDVIELVGHPAVQETYDARRALQVEIFCSGQWLMSPAVILAPSTNVDSMAEAQKICDAIWAKDGEGIILKRRRAPYQPGKRSKDFLKLKNLRHATLTVIGFEPSRGEIQNRGDYAVVKLRDSEGFETTVKTLNDACLARFEQEANGEKHPAIGRKLMIEFTERTPDGRYREPRWDRWATE
jgi:bifunctional non-homologous end joining protein LigD